MIKSKGYMVFMGIDLIYGVKFKKTKAFVKFVRDICKYLQIPADKMATLDD
jgi:glycerol-3-phosphate responsive antiterminator